MTPWGREPGPDLETTAISEGNGLRVRGRGRGRVRGRLRRRVRVRVRFRVSLYDLAGVWGMWSLQGSA